MIRREEALRLREPLLSLIDPGRPGREPLAARLDAIAGEEGIPANAALLLLLTGRSYEEDQARGHWIEIENHRAALLERIGRDVGIRVAAFDYFVNVDRTSIHPRLIDLHDGDPADPSGELDTLTGLAGAGAFRVAVQREVRRSRRYGPGFVVARLDVDGLEEAMRRFGSPAADALLRETGFLIQNRVRDIDLAARLAGGEFGIVLPGNNRAGGAAVCERIRAAFERHFRGREFAGTRVGLAVSVGIGHCPSDAVTPEDVVRRAAEALFLAKAGGGNRVAACSRERRRVVRFDMAGRGVGIRAFPAAGSPAGPGEEIPGGTSPDARLPVEDATGNIGEEGLLFRSAGYWPLGSEILLEIAGRDTGDSIRSRGRVVRIEGISPPTPSARRRRGDPVSDSRYEVGVVFQFDGEKGEREFRSAFRRWSLGAHAAGPDSRSLE
jgi:diguanylate cyclase (GGDEF)-like protein